MNTRTRWLNTPPVVTAYRFELSFEKASSAVTRAPVLKSCRMPQAPAARCGVSYARTFAGAAAAPAALLLSFVAGSAVRRLALATICLAADVTFSMSLSHSPFNGISFVTNPPNVLMTRRSVPPGPKHHRQGRAQTVLGQAASTGRRNAGHLPRHFPRRLCGDRPREQSA
jgi:hypothetical protein